jgi:hypothetical protein
LRIRPLAILKVWLSGTAAAMIINGFLNVSPAQHSYGLAQAFSLIPNLLLAVGLAWPVRHQLLHNWQMLGILIVTVVELFGWWR